MTQPIQEPTGARTDSRLTWGQNQLFRRPAPPTGGTPSVFRANQWNNELTTPTSTDMEPILFDFWSNPDSSIFSEVLDGGGDLVGVELLVPGFIVATLILNWEVSFDFSVAGLIADNEAVWPPAGNEATRKMSAGHGTGMGYLISMSRYYPTIDWEEGHGGNELPDFRAYAGQASGSARDVQGRMDICYFDAAIGPVTEA